MKFTSAVTPKGNSSTSNVSQEEADAQASALDANGCRNCRDCRDCTNCLGCRDCQGCIDCHDCRNCRNCQVCLSCTSCHDCHDCSVCHSCVACRDCMGCHGCRDSQNDVIQAGLPNGWRCYGWLKEGKLIIHCGCREKSFAEAIEYWSGKPDRVEILAACHYIAAVANDRGWPL